METHTEELTELIQQVLGKPADVFYAVRDVKGKLTKGYWYRIWTDETRRLWDKFDYLADNYADARRKIMRMKV